MPARLSACAKRGFTLTELAIVMGVIGTVIGAIWWAGGNANEMRKENAAFTELQTVVQNMLTLMQGRTLSQCGGSSTITSCMLGATVIPTSYANAGNSAACLSTNSCLADNPWSSKNFFIKLPGAAVTSKSFVIEFDNVPQQGCVALISQATSCQMQQSGCPTAVKTNGTDGTTALPTPSLATGGWQTAASVTNIADPATGVCTGATTVSLTYSL